MQRGSSKYGADVVVGSSEYMKRWREANKEKHQLAVLKYRARQKELILAAKLAKDDGIPLEQAIQEVRGTVDKLDLAKKLLIEEGRISPTFRDFEQSVVVDRQEDNPIVLEYATMHGIPYADADRIMDQEPNAEKWDVLMEDFKREKLANNSTTTSNVE